MQIWMLLSSRSSKAHWRVRSDLTFKWCYRLNARAVVGSFSANSPNVHDCHSEKRILHFWLPVWSSPNDPKSLKPCSLFQWCDHVTRDLPALKVIDKYEKNRIIWHSNVFRCCTRFTNTILNFNVSPPQFESNHPSFLHVICNPHFFFFLMRDGHTNPIFCLLASKPTFHFYPFIPLFHRVQLPQSIGILKRFVTLAA